MFKIVEERKVWWPVEWLAPVDGGKVASVKIEMQFVLVSTDDYQRIAQDAGTLEETDSSLSLSQRKADILMHLIADWKSVGDEDGKAIEFSNASLSRFFGMPGTFLAVLEAYGRCINGIAEHRRKN